MESTHTKRRSWLRPRFSLRAALLAFTAFAIGLPIWYRWPYEERQPTQRLVRPGAPVIIRSTTWQRQWGGSRLKHGPERIIIDGKTFSVTAYSNGHKDGPFMDFALVDDLKLGRIVPSDDPATIGQYVDGEKDGVWTEIVGDQKSFTTYHHGKQFQP